MGSARGTGQDEVGAALLGTSVGRGSRARAREMLPHSLVRDHCARSGEEPKGSLAASARNIWRAALCLDQQIDSPYGGHARVRGADLPTTRWRAARKVQLAPEHERIDDDASVFCQARCTNSGDTNHGKRDDRSECVLVSPTPCGVQS
jgi:hypothetical protein